MPLLGGGGTLGRKTGDQRNKKAILSPRERVRERGCCHPERQTDLCGPVSINVNDFHNDKVYKINNIGYNSDMEHHSYFCKKLTNSSRFTSHSSHKCSAFTLAEVFHPLRRYCKIAFTLAEVLITLGIIGVVAALTMPSLIQNYQKSVLKNQFKKSYNIIQNAYRTAEMQFGYTPLCYYSYDNVGSACLERNENGDCIKYAPAGNPTNQTSECTSLNEQLKSIYKTSKICKGNSLANGCIPSYKGLDTIYKENHPDVDNDYDVNIATSGCAGWRKNYIDTRLETWDLSDGTIILWYSPMLFAVDINGKKAPNKWGHDLFTFMVQKQSSGNIGVIPMSGACSPIEVGGMYAKTMLREIYK